MQHEIFIHPVARLRRPYPFIAVLQSDYASSDEILCAPLLSVPQPAITRGAPRVAILGQVFLLALLRMTPVPARMLRKPVGSVAAYRDDILRALDWLFTGV